MTQETRFPIPFMVLLREDIKSVGEQKRYTDRQMERIAYKMSGYFLQDWESNLRLAVQEVDEE